MRYLVIRQYMLAISAILGSLVLPFEARAEWKQELRQALKNGGAYAVDESGTEVFSHRADQCFVPASTIKIATAAAALSILGEKARFKTEFYLLPGDALGVKGYGDPSLVSEELAMLAQALSKRFKTVSSMLLDLSYFSPQITIDGASATTNPYDAANGALMVNYNTVYLQRSGKSIISAEPQTPLTPTAKAAASRMKLAKERLNLGADPRTGARYFAELLGSFLKSNGTAVHSTIEFGPVPTNARLLYTHHSRTSLADISRSMLEFSTNFIANQLFLLVGAQRFGPPATSDKAARALEEFLQNEVGLTAVKIRDGAGLSHGNCISPRQMIRLLQHFSVHSDLLPVEEQVFRAKTGSLRGVNTLAGYFFKQNGEKVLFAILVNSAVPFNYKFELAKKLYRATYN